MATLYDNENPQPAIPANEFNPDLFWEKHKKSILVYGAILLLAGIVFLITQIVSQRHRAAAEQAFANAHSEQDLKALAQKFPDTTVAANAQLLLAAQLRDAKKYDEAIATLQPLITNQQPEYPLLSSAWLSLAATQFAAGKTEDALKTYQTIQSKFPNSFASPISLVEQAAILAKQGKAADARRALEDVVAQYPDSSFVQSAMLQMQMLPK